LEGDCWGVAPILAELYEGKGEKGKRQKSEAVESGHARNWRGGPSEPPGGKVRVGRACGRGGRGIH